MIEFLRSFGALLGAGVPLAASLEMVSKQAGDASIARFGRELQQQILSGLDVADALAAALESKANYLPGLIAAGQATGDLGGALQQAATQLDEDRKILDEFWSALSYPLFILAASIVAIVVLMTLVVPSIVPLVAQEGGGIPIALRMLLATSGIMTEWGPTFVLFLAASLTLLALGYRVGLLRLLTDRVILDGPLGPIFRSLWFGRFASVLGHLLAAGAFAPDALRLASGGLSNRLARSRIESASRRLFEGAPLSGVLEACQGVPASIARMAVIGEGTGRLGDMLIHAGRMEQQRAVRILQKVGRWLAPALIVGLGVVIGGVMAGLLGGIMSLGEAVLD